MRYRFPLTLGVWLAAKGVSFVCLVTGYKAAALWFFFGPDPWFLWQILVPGSAGFGPVITRFRTQQREVWLTIDDGPDPSTTPTVLDLLDRYGARATFFVIGENVRRHPGLTREIVLRGHTLANHTSQHPCRSFWAAGPARTSKEIDDCSTAIRDAGLSLEPYFRPPVGIKTPYIHPQLAKRGFDYVAWSARGFDSIAKPDTACRRILRQLKPGAIVLLHEGDGDLKRVRVIEKVLAGMSAAGFSAAIPKREQLE